MVKFCPSCEQPFKNGELIELVIIAPWHEIKSVVNFSVGKPVDTYPDSLIHHECAVAENDLSMDN